MDFNDLFKLRPVSNYDVVKDKLAYVVWSDKPEAFIMGEGEIKVEGYVEEVNWIDEKRLALTVDPKGGEQRQLWVREKDGRIEKLLVDNYDNYTPFFITDDKFLFLSNRDGVTLHLYLYDNGEITKISSGNMPVFGYCSDKRRAVYTQGIYDNDVIVYNIEKNTEEAKISFPDSEEYPSSEQCITKDGVLFTSNVNNFADIGLWKFNDEIEWLIKSNHDKGEALFFKGTLYYLENEDGKFKLKSLDGRVIFEGGLTEELKATSDRLYFIAMTYNRDMDLYYFDGSNVNRITDSLNGVDTNDFVRPIKIRYKSFDGIEIPALVYSKGNEDKGIVYIHGGPDWQCTESFNTAIQFLVKYGFKVICPNYRGSTGYGRRFNHLNDKDLGGGDLRDVIEAVKVLNVKRVAVTGGSYGGYLTMMAVTKYPDIWCGAAAIVPFVNWFTEKQFEREYLKQYDEIKMGNDENLLRDRSPIFFVDRIRAPLLILAGENDPRCPAEETLQIVEKLKEMGRSVEYKIYKDVGHGITTRREYEVDLTKRVVEFLSSHCGEC